jgi:hypothetical protein
MSRLCRVGVLVHARVAQKNSSGQPNSDYAAQVHLLGTNGVLIDLVVMAGTAAAAVASAVILDGGGTPST